MKEQQRLWWEQVRADHAVLAMLRKQDAAPCQHLHYLQMVTEKLGKAYFWRAGHAPRKSHSSFVRFLQALTNRSNQGKTRISNLLGFDRRQEFENWIRIISPLAFELEQLAPSLAGSTGPNPEYPWPWENPKETPATFEFPIWKKLTGSSRGRQFLLVIDRAVVEFPKYC